MAVATSPYTDKTDEQKDITAMVRQFVDNEVLPIAEQHDHEDSFPDVVVEQMRGFSGLFWGHDPRGVRGNGARPLRPTR